MFFFHLINGTATFQLVGVCCGFQIHTVSRRPHLLRYSENFVSQNFIIFVFCSNFHKQTILTFGYVFVKLLCSLNQMHNFHIYVCMISQRQYWVVWDDERVVFRHFLSTHPHCVSYPHSQDFSAYKVDMMIQWLLFHPAIAWGSFLYTDPHPYMDYICWCCHMDHEYFEMLLYGRAVGSYFYLEFTHWRSRQW